MLEIIAVDAHNERVIGRHKAQNVTTVIDA
jgi:hypothetical protein